MKLSVNLKNCYGIHNLSEEFDFGQSPNYMIYAPNGTMKSSFAQSFKDFSEKRDSKDRIYSDRETIREIILSDGGELLPENIFVIEPYNEDYESNQISTLLVSKELKKRYDEIYDNINKLKDDLISKLKKLSGLKTDEIERTFSLDVTRDPKGFFKAINRVHDEIIDSKATNLEDVVYNKIFNSKIITELEKKEFRDKLKEYIANYDQLISSSNFFKKGIFNHNNASDIAKSLRDNGFFKANHGVYINELGRKIEISTVEDLENIIIKEKESILNDPSLQNSFNELDKILSKNKDLREFREYIEGHKFILPMLSNLDLLKETLWISYLHREIDTYKNLYTIYQDSKQELNIITEQANKEKTEWINIIDIFNKRFSVPFIVTIGNQEDVILRNDTPNIVFNFKDDIGSLKPVNKKDLFNTLSNGEKRALYLLNIIFEVEARKKGGINTIFIVDDIADSFDYKNKYAIIEYLKDISNIDFFKQIILTHNFDFYRTICSRLEGPRDCHLQAIKNGKNILIKKTFYQNDPLLHWKKHLENNNYLIACIPFLRNLSNYCGYCDEFNKLTSLLHITEETPEITIATLESIIHTLWKDKIDTHLDIDISSVCELIYKVADEILDETEENMELEKKIVLSIAIRLKTEEFIIQQIKDPEFVKSLVKNQTYELIRKYKELFPEDEAKISILNEVNLMTPENIHINSFMYEPILDMSNIHLKELYREIKGL